MIPRTLTGFEHHLGRIMAKGLLPSGALGKKHTEELTALPAHVSQLARIHVR